jgi:hypothetical protein
MTLGVQDRARRIGTFRAVEVRLMEMAAAWTPTTPELEVKVMLGRHIWDFAQHADALGKRMLELRRQAQESVAPAPEYAALLDEVLALPGTADRLAALYDVVLPGVRRRYTSYAAAADAVVDAPSLVILERILADAERQKAEADRIRGELGLGSGETGPLAEREAALPLLAVGP